MANNDNLGILIRTLLDQQSKKNVATEVDNLVKSLQQKLGNIKINIGGAGLQQLVTQLNQISKLTKNIGMPQKGLGVQFEYALNNTIKNLESSGRKVTATWDQFGKVVLKTTNEATGVTEKYNYQWTQVRDKLGAVRDQLVRVNKEQGITGQGIEKLQAKYQGLINTLSKGKLGKFIDNNEIKALENSLKNLTVVDGKITTDLQNKFNAIKQNAQQIADKNTQMANESARSYKLQIAEQIRLNRLKEQKFNSNLNEELRAYKLKNQETTRLIANEKKLELARRDAQNNVNKLTGQYANLYDKSKLQAYLDSVNKLTPATKNLQHQLQLLNREFNSIKTDAINKGLNTANKNAISLSEALRTAFTKFPIWMISGTVLFQSFNFFKDGITWVNEFNKSLTELSIVYMKNQEYVENIGKEIRQLGMEMSIANQELAQGAVEFARQGLSQQETIDRMQTTAKYAKISNLGFAESAKIMTAAINSMGVSAERAADVWSYMGDATATGKMCPPI